MLRRKIDLPVAALAACLRWENLGEGHPVIAETPVWRNDDAIRENDEAARSALAKYDLIGERGLDPDFRQSLQVLAQPSIEYSCWAKDHNGASSALVASAGREAVLAVRNGDQLHLAPVSAERQAEELVALLPQHAPAREQAINVSRADYDELLAPDVQMLHGGTNNAHAKRLHAILHRPRECAAEFHAASRDRSGTRRRARQRSMIDTDQGRWLIYLRQDDWIVAVPATNRELADALYEMRQTIT